MQVRLKTVKQVRKHLCKFRKHLCKYPTLENIYASTIVNIYASTIENSYASAETFM